MVLTAREWVVLERLLSHRGAIVTKGDIEDSLYAFGAEIESNAVEVYVSRLRKKLGRDFVGTARGLGYQVHPRHGQIFHRAGSLRWPGHRHRLALGRRGLDFRHRHAARAQRSV